MVTLHRLMHVKHRHSYYAKGALALYVGFEPRLLVTKETFYQLNYLEYFCSTDGIRIRNLLRDREATYANMMQYYLFVAKMGTAPIYGSL